MSTHLSQQQQTKQTAKQLIFGVILTFQVMNSNIFHVQVLHRVFVSISMGTSLSRPYCWRGLIRESESLGESAGYFA